MELQISLMVLSPLSCIDRTTVSLSFAFQDNDSATSNIFSIVQCKISSRPSYSMNS